MRIERGDYYTPQRGSLGRKDQRQFYPLSVSNKYDANLNAIASICREHELLCVFVTQPSGYHSRAASEFRASFWMTPPNESYTVTFESLEHVAGLYNRFLKTWAASHGFPVVDLAARIEPGFASFYDDMHFNESGAAAASDALAEELRPLVPIEAAPARRRRQ